MKIWMLCEMVGLLWLSALVESRPAVEPFPRFGLYLKEDPFLFYRHPLDTSRLQRFSFGGFDTAVGLQPSPELLRTPDLFPALGYDIDEHFQNFLNFGYFDLRPNHY